MMLLSYSAATIAACVLTITLRVFIKDFYTKRELKQALKDLNKALDTAQARKTEEVFRSMAKGPTRGDA